MKKTMLLPSHKNTLITLFVLLFFPLMLASCASAPASLEDTIAFQNSTMSDEYKPWLFQRLQAGPYVLAAARKSAELPLQRIYIEGDGRAYISRDTPAGDPTPINPVALKLALKDPTPGILYLARPCQWFRGPGCIGKLPEKSLWTEGRYTQQVVDAYTSLIEEQSAGHPVELIGYSGGAFIALQVAARLSNVTQVTSIAGNLAPEWLNSRHKVTAIPVAPYPAESRLTNLPTYIYMGETDATIPPEILPAYATATGAQFLHPTTVPATSHATGWENFTLPPASQLQE